MPDALKTLLLLLSSQLPLVGGGWLWWTGRVPVRPLSAALLVVGYELILFAGAFVKKVWSTLEPDVVDVAADWVRNAVRDASGFRRRYKKQVISDHGIFNVRGLGLINTYTLTLDQVFVDVRIDPSNPQKFNVDPIARKELAGNRPIWEFLRADSGVGEATALAVIGPPGCGKTTLLQHVAVTLAANRQRCHQVRAHTPVLLFLRDHVEMITREQPPALGKLVQDYFGDGQLFPTLGTPRGWFERRLGRGDCMILLDGLDEVADADERRRVSAWVDVQIKNYPHCRFILTSRPQGYSDAPLHRAHVLEVQPFNAGQVQGFVEKWYLANEIVASHGREDESVRARARKDAEDLLRRLQALPSLAALTVNPLLLTMIAIAHRCHGALPGSRVELYAEICEVLLGRWRQSRGVHDALKSSQKLVVLRPLAAHMMERKIRDITTAESVSVVAGPLERVGVAGETAEKFLRDVQSGSGLLLEREAGRWSFAHLTFQEYLTAARWIEQQGRDYDWGELVSDGWWHEMLRLYAAQGDATPLVRACLDVDTVPALALAADFLEEARELLPQVRRDAEQRLVADLEADDYDRRRIAAEVQLARRLKNLQREDDRPEIDLDFITCAEYQLFLDDVRAQGEYRQPDHWTGLSFLKGDALRPVVGMRSEDAAAFCDWLTQRQGGGVRYRLPHLDEAHHYRAKTSVLAAWCGNPNSFSLTGLAPADEQAIRRQLAGLSTLPLPSVLSRASALDSARARAFARALDIERALDRARARAFARDLAFARARAIDLDFTLARTLARDLDLDGDLGGDLDRDLALARDLTRTRDLDLALARDLDLARDLARDLDLACGLARGLPHNRDLRYASYRAFVIALAIACAHARTLVLTLGSAKAGLSDELIDSQKSIQEWLTFPDVAMRRWATLLNDLLTIASAPTLQAVLLAQRKYAARILEYAYLSSKEGERKARFSRLLRWLPFRKEAHDAEGAFQQDVLEFYWWLQIVVAREEGRLPAWEGIRVVWEPATEKESGEGMTTA